MDYDARLLFISQSFLWEQETKQQRSDEKEAKGDMMEEEKTLVEREMVQINIMNLQGIETVPRDSLGAAHPLPIVCLTRGGEPVRAAGPRSSTNQ